MEDEFLDFEKGQTPQYIRETIEKKGLAGLRVFLMFEEDLLEDYAIFKELTFLKTLSWCVAAEVPFDFLYDYTSLEVLNIQTPFMPIDFGKVAPLQALDLTWRKDTLLNLDAQQSLRALDIVDYKKLKDLTDLPHLPHLKSLAIRTGQCKTLHGIERYTGLEKLSLGAFRSITAVDPLAALQALRFLALDIFPKLQDCSPLGDLANLEVLELADVKNLRSLDFVKPLKKLDQLSLTGSTVVGDKDLTPAQHVPKVWYGHKKDYVGDLRNRDTQPGDSFVTFKV